MVEELSARVGRIILALSGKGQSMNVFWGAQGWMAATERVNKGGTRKGGIAGRLSLRCLLEYPGATL